MIRVLIVDDSPLQRNLLKMLLESDRDIQIVGTAENGVVAVQMTKQLKPDLITMDIRMPVMDGFEATRQIMQEQPTPIVVVSSSVAAPDLAITFNAIQAGALEVIEKPSGSSQGDVEAIRQRLIATVKGMAMVKVTRRQRARTETALALPPVTHPDVARFPRVLAIGASTGGPPALSALLRALPHNFSLPIVIVQHMAVGFTEGFARWLQKEINLPVVLACDQQAVQPGKVYFAPDELHLVFVRRGLLGTTQAPPVSFVRPSATVLFNSVAQIYGAEAIGVILTGMGNDGAAGLQMMHQRGAVTIAQDEATSVIYGMPRVAVELGAVDHLLPLEAIAPALVAMTK